MTVTTFELPRQNCRTLLGRPLPRSLDKITGVIVHSTGGSAESAVNWFKNRRSHVSAHATIRTDGVILKALFGGRCLETVMYHAGISRGWEGKGCNLYTVGVEYEHVDRDRSGVWPSEQIDAAVEWILAIKKVCPNLRYIARHRDVAPGRKVDPDSQYPIDEVAARTGLIWWRPQMTR